MVKGVARVLAKAKVLVKLLVKAVGWVRAAVKVVGQARVVVVVALVLVRFVNRLRLCRQSFNLKRNDHEWCPVCP